MLTELLNAILSWQTFAVALVVFGFAPGALLRLIVLAFPREDPRRRELLAELHAVHRLERPFWVIEQLEVALFEGVWERLIWAATGRVIWRYRLLSGVKQNRKHPETFEIPDEEDKQAIEPGVLVKLLFDIKEDWGGWRGHLWGERMWVEIVAVKRRHIVGVLRNQPIGIPRLDWGDRVKFKRDHIIGIIWEDDSPSEPAAEVEDDDTIDVDPESNGPDDYLSEPLAEDPDHDHIVWIHSGCNGPPLALPAETPELPPPEPLDRA
jgi:Uncharacterized protein conserved in bacteria (DUF2314)